MVPEHAWLYAGARAVGVMVLAIGVGLPVAVMARRGITRRLCRSDRAGRGGSLGGLQPLAEGIRLMVQHPGTAAQGGASGVRIVGLWCALVSPLGVLILLPYASSTRAYAAIQGPAGASVLHLAALLALAGLVPAFLGSAGGTWSSRTGGMRATTAMAAAMPCVGLCLAGVAVMAASPLLGDITAAQVNLDGLAPRWNLIRQPAGFAVCVAGLMLWCQTPPFDIGSAAPELNGGYLAPCSGGERAWLHAAAHLRRLSAAVLLTILYLGGADWPWGTPVVRSGVGASLLDLGTVMGKAGILWCGFVWIETVLPDIRFGSIKRLAWRRLLVLAVVNLLWCRLLTGWLSGYD